MLSSKKEKKFLIKVHGLKLTLNNNLKDFVQNISPRDGKTASSRKAIWEIGTKWFPLARKSVSTSQNKGFVVKVNLH